MLRPQLRDDVDGEYSAFVDEIEPRLRRALVALRGPEDGREAVAEALAWAWENWHEVRTMHNPAGYLYRVGQSRSRRASLRRTAGLPPVPHEDRTHVEPGLPRALALLSDRQRVIVVLVTGWGWPQAEVAALLDVSPETVRTHLRRAMTTLRRALHVVDVDEGGQEHG